MELHEQGGHDGHHQGNGHHGTSGAAASTNMHPAWARDAVFYQIYPLGLLGAPRRNEAGIAGAPLPQYQSGSAPLDRLLPWVDHLAGLGFDAIYLGPVFESTGHGYDTIDYSRVDRRLGDNASLKRFVDACHGRGIRVVLDAVLNHVGRHFPAFRDVQARGADSAFKDWFAKLDFSQRGPAGDDFAYEGWHGHYDLVKLDGGQAAVRDHLFGAISGWVAEFGIDGLRLDAADCLSFDFLQGLAAHCRSLKPDFWLMGEVVHGDYRHWANPACLHTVTNYEAYKGLWSSLNDRNYWEIDWTLKRQFGPSGTDSGRYRELALYNFADNHDVDRVASSLTDPAKLGILYTLLFAMPGMPSVYYGSEWGMTGQRRPGSDDELRPAVHLAAMQEREARGQSQSPRLCGHIHRLIQLRRRLPALRRGGYRAVHVANEQFAFWRAADHAPVLAVFNQAESAFTQRLDLGFAQAEGRWLQDQLDEGYRVQVLGGQLEVALGPRQARLLVVA